MAFTFRTYNADELFDLLNESDGSVILDAGLNYTGKRPFIRVIDNQPQMITVIPAEDTSLDENEQENQNEDTDDPEEEYGEDNKMKIESQPLEREEMFDRLEMYDEIIIRPKSQTPFADETQEELFEQS